MFEITMIGNLTRDPNTRTVKLPNGDEVHVTDFFVACNRQRRDGTQVASYVRVTAWRGLADLCAQYLSKGKKVYVRGIPSANSFVGQQDGQVHAQLEVAAERVEFLTPTDYIPASQRTAAATAEPAATAPVAPAAAPDYNAQPAMPEMNMAAVGEAPDLPF